MLLAERARTARLEHILKLINRTTFGKRSEKLSADQLALALEDQAVALGEAQGLQDKTDEETERYGLRPRKRRPAGAERGTGRAAGREGGGECGAIPGVAES